jgi:hypothetical protein
MIPATNSAIASRAKNHRRTKIAWSSLMSGDGASTLEAEIL